MCAAHERLVLRLLYVFCVCLFVCLFVRPHLSRAQYSMSYVTMQLPCIAAFGGLLAKLQQMKVVLCCLDGENLVGSRKYPVFVTSLKRTTKLPTQHFRCTAFDCLSVSAGCYCSIPVVTITCTSRAAVSLAY